MTELQTALETAGTAARYLVDVSALVRYPEPEVGKRLDGLATAGTMASCGVVELQLLGALHDPELYARVAGLRRQVVEMLETTEADFGRALQVQALLVERREFRVPWTALVVAAVAERYGVAVVHANPCFGLIAGVAGTKFVKI